MAIKFEKIEPGMVLYDRHTYQMGNSKMRRMGEWTVKIIEVDRDRESALVSWNGNAPTTRFRRQLEKLYRKSKDDGKSTGTL